MALEAYLMAFIEMPSGPAAFLGFKDFIIKLISAAVGLENQNGSSFWNIL